MSILFLILYVSGFIFLFFSTRKKKSGLDFLKSNFEQSSNLLKTKDTKTNIEKAVIRSSKLAFITDKIDGDTKLKTLFSIVLLFLLTISYKLKLVDVDLQIYMVIFILMFSLIIILPGRISQFIIKNRIKKFSSNLPYVVDIICICVQSGATIEYSIRYVAKNIGVISKEVALTFERLSKKIELNGLESALNELYNEVPTSEVRAFCLTLQQSSEYGSSVYDILVTLSSDIREMQLLETEEKVSALSAKMTVPMMLFIMFPLIVIVAGPGFIGMLNIWSN